MKGRTRRRLKGRFENAKERAIKLYHEIKKKIGKSIKLEILTVVAIALVIATLLGILTVEIGQGAGVGRHYYNSYEENREEIQDYLARSVQEINGLDTLNIELNVDIDEVRNIMENYSGQEAVEQLGWLINGSIVLIEGDHSTREYYNIVNDQEGTMSTDHSGKLTQFYKKALEMSKTNNWDEEVLEAEVQKIIDIGQLIKNFKDDKIKEVLNRLQTGLDGQLVESQAYLINSRGQALYQDTFVQTIDITKAIQKAGERFDEERMTSIYPIIMNGEIGYLIHEGVLRGRMVEFYTDTAFVLGCLVGLISFVFLMFRFTSTKIRYIEYISYCLTEISKGNLHYKVEVVGEDELAQVATDIVHMEQEIRKQMEAQRQAEKVKNELITNVAHDLRTPLTSIIGYIGLLKEGKYEDEEERQKYTNIAYQKSEKLKVLIEDLFEYTKLHNQEAKLKLEPVSLTHLLNQLAEELMPLGEERGIMIHTHVHTENTKVTGDIQKLMRAFENLIGNAIKYSAENQGVHIHIAEDRDCVVVAIQNQCENMPEGDLNKLFDRFYRSDASRNSETGGSGLGLAIAKNIVMLHGGQIWAQSKDNIISFNMKLRK